MVRGGLLLASTLLLASALAGCTTSDDPTTPEGPDPVEDWPRCSHPWPCGDGSEWPTDLVGPFESGEPEHVTIESFDGTLLDGWLWRPNLPQDVGAPALLVGTPYLGTCTYQSISAGSLSCTGDGGSEDRVTDNRHFGDFLAQGYAVAFVSVRGTGGSGGCYGYFGEDEQKDQAVVVEWLASQEWSNGRVAMTGLSYEGTTPWGAAIQGAASLKAITVAGTVTDSYLSPATPQGAIERGYEQFRAGTVTANSLLPPTGGADGTLLPYAAVAAERLCPDVVDHVAGLPRDGAQDQRNAAYWEERRLITEFDSVTASVLVAHGLRDDNVHRYQEDIIWSALDHAPKWFLLGQWEHTLALEEFLATHPTQESWYAATLAWYDFWLKGLRSPPEQIGRVDYQDSSGSWRNDTAWPPAGRQEAMHLNGERLSPSPSSQERLLALRPIDDDSLDCTDDPPSVDGEAPQLVYTTDPMPAPVVVAGNPFGVFTVEADGPSGVFGADLRVAKEGWTCETGGESRSVTGGGVDLRFHAGTMTGADFPVNTPTDVRIDFYNIAERIQPGERLVLILRNCDDFLGQCGDTTLSVHGSSSLVLPVVDGTLGANEYDADAPPRPFARDPA